MILENKKATMEDPDSELDSKEIQKKNLVRSIVSTMDRFLQLYNIIISDYLGWGTFKKDSEEG